MHMYGYTCINISVYKIPTRVLDAQLAPLAQHLLLCSVDLSENHNADALIRMMLLSMFFSAVCVCACVVCARVFVIAAPAFPPLMLSEPKPSQPKREEEGGGVYRFITLMIYLAESCFFFPLHRFASMHTYVSLLHPGHIHEMLHCPIFYTTDRIDRFYPQQ